MRFPSGLRLGTTVAGVAALASTALLTTGGPVHAASHAHPHPGHHRLLPLLTHGRAVAALRAAEHAFPGGLAARRSAPTRFLDGTPLMRDLAWARPSLRGADRAQADRLLATPSYNASRRTTHFDIHYVKSGLLSGPNAATSAYVGEVGAVLEHVYAREVQRMGFRKPLVPSGSTRIAIYLQNLQPDGYYGYCAPASTQSNPQATPPVHDAAYCVLDNDFVGYPSGPAKSLKVTAAHEFFHAIQFGYDTGEDKWLMEGSAVWMEDRVYDSINDYLQYVDYSPIRRPRLPVDLSDDSSPYGPPINVYGAFTFFKFLTSWLHAPNAVRQVWQYADAGPARNPYSLQAVDRVIRDHGRGVRTAIARFGAWNTLPTHSYEERASYHHAPGCPAAGCVRFWKDLTLRRGGTGLLATSLRHLASAPVRIRPAASLGRHATLHLRLDVPDLSHGGAATLQVRHRSGHVSTVVLPLDAHGNLRRNVGFDPRHISAVVVVLTNGSTAMRCPPRHAVGHYSCDGSGAYAGRYTLRAHL